MPHIPFVRLRSPDQLPAGYPFDLPAIRNMGRLELAPVTYFVGENGSGKSTLLEALAMAAGLNPEGGTQHMRFQTRPSHSDLHRHIDCGYTPNPRLSAFFLRAESFFNVATELERMDREDGGAYSHLLTQRVMDAYGGRSLHEQSHGEGFMALFLNRLRPGGLYFMDEPEAALSPLRQMTLLAAMHDLVRGGAQLVIATHAPIVLAYPGAFIYQFGEEGIRRVEYEETDTFTVTRDFVTNRQRMLRALFEED
jgi:predicted ATPase